MTNFNFPEQAYGYVPGAIPSKMVYSEVQPENPVEGLFWVDTSEEQKGDIWFFTSYTLSGVPEWSLIRGNTEVTPEMFGYRGTNPFLDTIAINSAISYLSLRGGGDLKFRTGITYKVTNAGAGGGGRGVAILLQPGVVLDLNGSTLKRADSVMDYDLVRGWGVGYLDSLVYTMGVKNGILEGNSPGSVTPNSTDGFNVWLYRIKNPVCENIVSRNSGNWGIRIQECQGGSFVGRIKTEHKTDVNADGVHFIDCKDMTGDSFEIFSSGDDGFIIEAGSYGCSNLNFTGIVCKTPQGSIAAGRGILIFRETGSDPNPPIVEIKDINVEAVVTEGGGSSSSGYGLAITLARCKLLNSKIQVIASKCQAAASVRAFGGIFPGEIRGCDFDVKSYSQRAPGGVSADIDFQTGIGIIDDNKINANTIDTPSGRDGILLQGSRWKGSLSADFLTGSKTVTAVGLNLYVKDSNLTIASKGYLVPCRIHEAGNTFTIGKIYDAFPGYASLQLFNPNNILLGGYVEGSITGATSDTRFIGTVGSGLPLWQFSQSATDSFEGKIPLLRELGGIFGIGAGTLPTLSNLDATVTRGGLFSVENSTTTGTWPTGYTGFDRTGVVLNLPHSGGLKLQIFLSAGKQKLVQRRWISGSWGGWFENSTVAL